MKYENLSKLISTIDKQLQEWGHTVAELNVGLNKRLEIIPGICSLKSKQKGVIRTNCMDCLDRTNVV